MIKIEKDSRLSGPTLTTQLDKEHKLRQDYAL